MKGEWVDVAIGDIAEIVGGSTPSTADKSNFDGGIPWLTPKDLSEPHGRYVSHGERSLSAKGLASCSSRLLPRNSVLLSSRAPIGYLAIAANQIATNQGFRSLVLGPGYDHEFLYYWLTANVEELERHASGSTFKELSGGALKKIHLRIPADVTEQRAIAHILGTLDDKIELNRRMNETLEAMARAIFKSWFVDFDPVRAKATGRDTNLPKHIADLFPDHFENSEMGEIPKGWQISTLGTHVVNFDSRRVPVSSSKREKCQGPFPYYGAAGVLDYVDDYLFDGIYLLVGEDGSVVQYNGLAITQYVWSKLWVNNHAHVLQGKGPVSTEQLYLYFQFVPVAAYVTGAVQPKLSQGRMNVMPFLFAGKDICRAFDSLVNPWFTKLRANKDAIKTLASLRDTLLPKMLSGEIRLNLAMDDVQRRTNNANPG